MGVGASDERGTHVGGTGPAVGIRGDLCDHRPRHPLLAISFRKSTFPQNCQLSILISDSKQ
jgi:hypothetical protein